MHNNTNTLELLNAVRNGRRHFCATDASAEAGFAFDVVESGLERLSTDRMIVLSACGRAMTRGTRHWLTGLTVLELTEEGLDHLWLGDVGCTAEGRSAHGFSPSRYDTL